VGECLGLDNPITVSTVNPYVGQFPSVRLRWGVAAANEANTFGAYYQLRLTEDNVHQGYVWWNPKEDMFTLTLGTLEFRPFSVLWGVGSAGDIVGLGAGGGGGDIFTGITPNSQGFAITSVLLDKKLVLGVGTGIGAYVNAEAYDAYARTALYAGYTIEDIGTAALGFNSNTGYYGGTGSEYNNPSLQLAFDLTAVEGVQAQIGVLIPFASKSDNTSNGGSKYSAVDPIKIALAGQVGQISNEGFGINGHILVKFGGKVVTTTANTDTTVESPFLFGATLNPWFGLAIGSIGLYTDILLTGAANGDKGDNLTWQLTPYFEKSGVGGGSFFVGFSIGGVNYFNDEVYKDDAGSIIWSIPVGVKYSF
jgi:hypothetical protein